MRIRILFIAVCLLCSAKLSLADSKDKRLQPIIAEVLQQMVQRTPLPSPHHLTLISRAAHSDIPQVAYASYTELWKRNKQNEYTNLYRGMAALEYWRALLFSTNKSLPKLSQGARQELYNTTRSCLSKAYEVSPKSPDVLAQYGFYLWQYDNQMDRGLELLRKAETLAPKNPDIHQLLGDVYSNKSGNAYNMKLAKKELQTALRLDPSYAEPYWTYMLISIWEGQYKLANQHMQEFLKLSPSDQMNKGLTREIWEDIQKHLQAK